MRERLLSLVKASSDLNQLLVRKMKEFFVKIVRKLYHAFVAPVIGWCYRMSTTYIHDGTEDIHAFLNQKKYKPFQAIHFNWMVFGDNEI